MEHHFAALHELSSDAWNSALGAIGDEEVRREVASLLRHAGNGDAVDSLVESVVGAMAVAAGAGELIDRRVGPWRLLRRLGQGGQGVVFEAKRDDGAFDQRVALKIVKWELDTEEARRRFRHERQVLAGLEHPSIARLLDGGETAGGTPYLVMEFVDGLPLTQAARDWPVRRKLQLFLEIAAAVSFAHRNLVVHRDLKPANILVTPEGVAKLLDFGISKLLDVDDRRTITGFHALTPGYASPEQLSGRTITTASDIYSLGVLLREMLTGRPPREKPGQPPGISGDIDNILLMAMREEPERRYVSVEQFAEDVRRTLDRRPVLARRDSFGYRTSRFLQRNAIAMGAGTAVFLSLAAGGAIALRQARIAGARFEQVRHLAHNFVFDYNDELAKLQGTTALREKMVRTAIEYLDNLARSAGEDLSLQKELAAAYVKVADAQGFPSRPNLGHPDQAMASYRKAAAIHERIVAADPAYQRELTGFYADFAQMVRYAGDLPEAARLSRKAVEIATGSADAHPRDVERQVELADAWCGLDDIDEDAGRDRAALKEFLRCDGISRSLAAHSPTFRVLKEAQGARERVGTAANSAGLLRESLEALDGDEELLGRLRALQPDDPNLLRNVGLLAQYRSTVWYDDIEPSFDDPAQALKYARQYLEAARVKAQRDPNDMSARFSLAVATFRVSFALKPSDPAGAVARARESVRLFDALLAEGKRGFLVTSRRTRALRRVAEALLAARQPLEAREAALRVLAEQRTNAAHDEKDFQEARQLSLALLTAAESEEASRHPAAALAFFREAESQAAAVLGANPEELTRVIPLARIRRELSAHWAAAGDDRQARQWMEEAQRLWREFPDQNDFVRSQLAGGRPGYRPEESSRSGSAGVR